MVRLYFPEGVDLLLFPFFSLRNSFSCFSFSFVGTMFSSIWGMPPCLFFYSFFLPLIGVLLTVICSRNHVLPSFTHTNFALHYHDRRVISHAQLCVSFANLCCHGFWRYSLYPITFFVWAIEQQYGYSFLFPFPLFPLSSYLIFILPIISSTLESVYYPPFIFVPYHLSSYFLI